MVDITEQNIREITVLVEARGVEMKELSYDLVDHICCMIEEKMESGKNYASALEESMSSFGKKGIRQIQEETTFLITKNILAMRKTMHITGITAAILLLFGTIFKIQHWPGAGLMYVLGATSLCFLFMPLFLTVRIKEKVGKLNIVTNVLGMLSAIALCLGILFKVMHWPWANILMNSGATLLILIFLPLYIYNGFKTNTLKTSTIVPVIIAVAGFSLMFSLVKLRNSSDVTNAILNIQYTIYDDTESTLKTNNSLLMAIQNDSTSSYQKANEVAEKINLITEDLEFLIAQSLHQEIPEEELHKAMRLDYYSISNDLGDLAFIRKDEGGLEELVRLINEYETIYQNTTGIKANISINDNNLEHYPNKEHTVFPLGVVIHDLSLLNLQVQRLHTSLLQYYKGKVS
ncbi:MAG: hypothetical protein JKX68_01790 [Flavobacteriales bacterium]|nr:hypothetical protein [Flavobacteriales bacterium]